MSNLTATRRSSAFGWAAVLVWIGILVATLYPFDFRPHNDVSWVAGGGGLRFGRHGVVTSQGPLAAGGPADDSRCSLEVYLRPASLTSYSTFLALSAADHPGQLHFHQYRDGIIVWCELPREDIHRNNKRDIAHFFNSGQAMLLTLTSGSKGTVVYSNGLVLERFPGFTLSRQAFNGDLTLGTDPVRYEPWAGELRGLALYHQELSPAQVARNYQQWLQGPQAHWEKQPGRIALYTFEEGQGTLVQNLVTGGTDLSIPTSFRPPRKPFLSSPRTEFKANWDYVNDVVRNVLGFMPLGLALYGYFWVPGKKWQAVVLATVFGALTSLGIEIAQAYEPERGSGLTDVLTNTLGTFLGAAVLRWKPLSTFLGNLPQSDTQTP